MELNFICINQVLYVEHLSHSRMFILKVYKIVQNYRLQFRPVANVAIINVYIVQTNRSFIL